MELIVGTSVRVGGVEAGFVLVLVLLGPVELQFALALVCSDKAKAFRCDEDGRVESVHQGAYRDVNLLAISSPSSSSLVSSVDN